MTYRIKDMFTGEVREVDNYYKRYIKNNSNIEDLATPFISEDLDELEKKLLELKYQKWKVKEDIKRQDFKTEDEYKKIVALWALKTAKVEGWKKLKALANDTGIYEIALRFHSMRSQCVCKHPRFVNGVCNFATCRHSPQNHA